MPTYTAKVTRDGRWWMIHLPALDDYDSGRWPGEAVTQARRFADVEREATDYISTVTNTAPGDIIVTVQIDDELADLFDEASKVIELKSQAARLERDAVDRSAHVAHALADRGVTVRDIGEILGVTYQRAAQLAAT